MWFFRRRRRCCCVTHREIRISMTSRTVVCHILGAFGMPGRPTIALPVGYTFVLSVWKWDDRRRVVVLTVHIRNHGARSIHVICWHASVHGGRPITWTLSIGTTRVCWIVPRDRRERIRLFGLTYVMLLSICPSVVLTVLCIQLPGLSEEQALCWHKGRPLMIHICWRLSL